MVRVSAAAYRVGDWFAIPLADGTFAPGRVVFHTPPQGVLGYVFAPRPTLPTRAELADLEPGDALLAQRFSGLHIGDPWPLLGGAGDVDRSRWKTPEFETDLRDVYPEGREVRVDLVDDQLRRVHFFHAPLSELGRRQYGGVMGAVALERWLLQQVRANALVPLRTQPWWDDPTPVPPGTGPSPAPEHLSDRVVVVVPGRGRSVGDMVEMTLMLGLEPEVGEVDGTMRSPNESEISVYGPDGRRLADRVLELVRPLRAPALRLLVRAGDQEWTLRPHE
ncbi:hypothetical protein SAMN05216467_3606 [Cellulomonas sp. KH9]|nr:hypothetical protein SAMN05216467_3606 [Cellulomonas sp. KH9]